MNNQTENYNFRLNANSIDECTEKTRIFTKSLGLSENECIRYSFSVDEIMLRTYDIFPDSEVSFSAGTKFFSPFISLEIKSDAFNAFADNEKNASVFGNSVLKNLGLSPEYSYINGVNTYLFNLKKKSINPFITLLGSLALAVICSMLGLLLPAEFRNGILDGFLTPIYDTFFNVLGCIAGPMVFLSVAWGIYGIGDAATLKKIGKRLLGSYMSVVFIVTSVFSFLCLPAFSLKLSGASEGGQGIATIFTMILDIIPSNIFSPFVEGNTLQIIFLAVVIGIALLFLGQKTNSVARAVEQINYIVQFLVEFICKLVPFFIFIAIIEMMWSDKAAVLVTVVRFFAVFISCIALEFIAIVTYTSIKNHVSALLLIKKGLPTLLIALTTASSAAAFGPNISSCDTAYGIEKNMRLLVSLLEW